MEAFFVIVGIVLTLIIGIIIAALVIESLLTKLDNYNARKEYAVISLARKRLGEEIISDSYWLSEEPELKTAFKILGEHISRSRDGNYQIEKVRDDIFNKIKQELDLK